MITQELHTLRIRNNALNGRPHDLCLSASKLLFLLWRYQVLGTREFRVSVEIVQISDLNHALGLIAGSPFIDRIKDALASKREVGIWDKESRGVFRNLSARTLNVIS